FGVIPLIISHGAGAEMRRVLGVAVFSGMLGVTLFGIFLTPVFFYVIEGFAESSLFATGRMRIVGKVLLYIVGILTLGIPWLLVLLMGKTLGRRAPAGLPSPAVLVEGGSSANGVAASQRSKDTVALYAHNTDTLHDTDLAAPHGNGATVNGHNGEQESP